MKKPVVTKKKIVEKKKRSIDIWEVAKQHDWITGRPKKFTPFEFLQKGLEYFQYVQDNPLLEEKIISGKRYQVAKMRAMTVTGFCLFAGITETTWNFYNGTSIDKKSEPDTYNDYLVVSSFIKKTIYQQKFEGASADLLNANIIARDLGLVDKSSNETNIRLEQITGMKLKEPEAREPGKSD